MQSTLNIFTSLSVESWLYKIWKGQQIRYSIIDKNIFLSFLCFSEDLLHQPEEEGDKRHQTNWNFGWKSYNLFYILITNETRFNQTGG